MTRQYCGQLGKQDNCQVAVSLSLANHDASLPIAYRLYLPKDWARDQARRDKARVPEAIAFQTKPEIAFEQIKAARATGILIAGAHRVKAEGRITVSHLREAGEDFLHVIEQLDAKEPDIRGPQGNSPDRHRTNTKP